MKDQMNIRHIVILASPYSTLLDVFGPMDVFQKATEHIDKLGYPAGFSYKIHIVTIGKTKTIEMSSGLSIVTEGSYKAINYPVDTLIVAGRSQKNRPSAGCGAPEMAERTVRYHSTDMFRMCRCFYPG